MSPSEKLYGLAVIACLVTLLVIAVINFPWTIAAIALAIWQEATP